MNNKLRVAIDTLDNDKIVKLINEKKKILNNPKKLNDLLYRLLKMASIEKIVNRDIQGGLELVNSMPVKIEGHDNLEHELLVASQNKNRDRAISLFMEYLNKEGAIVRLFKYASGIVKRCSGSGKRLENHLKSASRRDLLKYASGSVAC